MFYAHFWRYSIFHAVAMLTPKHPIVPLGTYGCSHFSSKPSPSLLILWLKLKPSCRSVQHKQLHCLNKLVVQIEPTNWHQWQFFVNCTKKSHAKCFAYSRNCTPELVDCCTTLNNDLSIIREWVIDENDLWWQRWHRWDVIFFGCNISCHSARASSPVHQSK